MEGQAGGGSVPPGAALTASNGRVSAKAFMWNMSTHLLFLWGFEFFFFWFTLVIYHDAFPPGRCRVRPGTMKECDQ